MATIIAQALKKKEEESDSADGVSTNLLRPDGEEAATNTSGESAYDPSEMEMVLQEIDIQFERADKGLGLSIAGGLGSTPYKNDDEGIFISRVTPNGPADLAGLRKDDKVVAVNGHGFVDVDHYEAVGILKAAGGFISMRVLREVFVTGNRARKQHQPREESASSSSSSASSLPRAPTPPRQQHQEHLEEHPPCPTTNGISAGPVSLMFLSRVELLVVARTLGPSWKLVFQKDSSRLEGTRAKEIF